MREIVSILGNIVLVFGTYRHTYIYRVGENNLTKTLLNPRISVFSLLIYLGFFRKIMEKLTKRKGFNFYRSYYDVFNMLDTDEDKLQFISALLDRQFLGTKPTELSKMVQFAYMSQVNSIDKQVKGYETKTGIPLQDPIQGPTQDPTQGPTVDPNRQEEGQGQGQEKEKVQVQGKEYTATVKPFSESEKEFDELFKDELK